MKTTAINFQGQKRRFKGNTCGKEKKEYKVSREVFIMQV